MTDRAPADHDPRCYFVTHDATDEDDCTCGAPAPADVEAIAEVMCHEYHPMHWDVAYGNRTKPCQACKIHAAALLTSPALATLRAQADDYRAAWRTAGESADRFRDVLSECLGRDDENPGDDVLIAELREHFGKTGPEPRRWRDFLVGAEAQLDQIRADRQEPQ